MRKTIKKVISSVMAVAMLAGISMVPMTSQAATTYQLPYAHTYQAHPASNIPGGTAYQNFGIICFGDSLTQGTKYGSYVYNLQNLLKNNIYTGFKVGQQADKVLDFGVGGERSAAIAARSNAIPATLSSAVTIPATGSVTLPYLKIQSTGEEAALMTTADANANYYYGATGSSAHLPATVTINGVVGTLNKINNNYADANGDGKFDTCTYTFTRSSAGSSVNCPAGTTVTFNAAQGKSNYIPIIFMGYNDAVRMIGGANGNTLADYYNEVCPGGVVNNNNKFFRYIDAIRAAYGDGKYIVICPHMASDGNAAYSNQIKAIESAYKARYGANVICVREQMVACGLSEVGLTANAAQQTQLNNYLIPTDQVAGSNVNGLLAKDASEDYGIGVHFTAKGYELLSMMVYEKLHDLGYLDGLYQQFNAYPTNINTGVMYTVGSGDPCADGHTPIAHAAIAKGCLTVGYNAYWECSVCHKLFTSEVCTTVTTLAAQTIPAYGSHDFHDGTCSRCGVTESVGTASVDVNFDRDIVSLDQAYVFPLSHVNPDYLSDDKYHLTDGGDDQLALLGACAVSNMILDYRADIISGQSKVILNAPNKDLFTDQAGGYVAYHLKNDTQYFDTVTVSLTANVRGKTNNGMRVYLLTPDQFLNQTLTVSEDGALNVGTRLDTSSSIAKATTFSLPDVQSNISTYTLPGDTTDEFYIVITANNASGTSSAEQGLYNGASESEYMGVSHSKSGEGGVYLSAVSIVTTNRASEAPHTHTPTPVAGKAAGCFTPGNNAYYECTDCHAFFKDADCMIPTTSADEVIPAYGAHDFHDGTCSRCGAHESSSTTYHGGQFYDLFGYNGQNATAEANPTAGGWGYGGDHGYVDIRPVTMRAAIDSSNLNNFLARFNTEGDPVQMVYAENVEFDDRKDNGNNGKDYEGITYLTTTAAGKGYITYRISAADLTELSSVDYMMFGCVGLDWSTDSVVKVYYSTSAPAPSDSMSTYLDGAILDRTITNDAAGYYGPESAKGKTKGTISDLSCDDLYVTFELNPKKPGGGCTRFTGVAFDVTMTVSHVHEGAAVETPATCTVPGTQTYYYCEGCDGYFEDEGCTAAIDDIDAWCAAHPISTAAHTTKHTGAAAADCVNPGNIEYWYCTVCHQYFSDADCKNAITENETVIAAAGHSVSHTERAEASCLAPGNIEYWCCTVCHKYFSDADCQFEITEGDTEIAVTGHSPLHTERAEASCLVPGNIEYWYCTVCHKCFSDADCGDEITAADTVIDALGHDMNDQGFCNRCGYGKDDHIWRLGNNIALEDSILLRYFLVLDEWTLGEVAKGNICVDITVTRADGKSQVVTYDSASLDFSTLRSTQKYSDGKSYLTYVFSIPTSAKQMTDVMTLTVTHKNSGEALFTYLYSIQEYCYHKLDSTKPYLADLVAAVAAYGKQAQIYASYRTDHYADEWDKLDEH